VSCKFYFLILLFTTAHITTVCKSHSYPVYLNLTFNHMQNPRHRIWYDSCALTALLTINSRLCNCCWCWSSEILGRFNLCHLQCIRLQKLRYFNLSGQTNRLPVYKVALLMLSNTQGLQIFTSLITVLNTVFSATTARLW